MLAPRRLPAAWTAHRSRRATAKTNRAQKRLDEQQLAKGRRAARKRRRAARWASFRPVALAVSAAVTFTAGFGSLGVLCGAIWGTGVGIGVGLVAGLLAATAAMVILEWRISG